MWWLINVLWLDVHHHIPPLQQGHNIIPTSHTQTHKHHTHTNTFTYIYIYTLPPLPPTHIASSNGYPYDTVLVHIRKWASWHRKNTTSTSCRWWPLWVQVKYCTSWWQKTTSVSCRGSRPTIWIYNSLHNGTRTKTLTRPCPCDMSLGVILIEYYHVSLTRHTGHWV